jgi:Uma2 family endonuclease
MSTGSEAMDAVVKRAEYARAGIPRYWVIERDAVQTVTLYQFGAGETYKEQAKMPLAWLLNTAPADHLD